MAPHKKFIIWTWFGGDTPKFVGYGRYGRQHPAELLYARRHEVLSPLNEWLRSQNSEPKRIDEGGGLRYYRQDAATIAAAKRRKYRSLGHRMLNIRPHGTKKGGGLSKMVLSPDSTIYTSVRHAAIDNDVNPCTITRWCQTEGSGWDYLD